MDKTCDYCRYAHLISPPFFLTLFYCRKYKPCKHWHQASDETLRINHIIPQENTI